MAEETLAFYVLVIPVMIAARYDAVTGVAIILGAGWLDSLPATDLARYLIGGVAVQDLPFRPEGMAGTGRLEDAAGILEARAGTLVSRS